MTALLWFAMASSERWALKGVVYTLKHMQKTLAPVPSVARLSLATAFNTEQFDLFGSKETKGKRKDGSSHVTGMRYTPIPIKSDDASVVTVKSLNPDMSVSQMKDLRLGSMVEAADNVLGDLVKLQQGGQSFALTSFRKSNNGTISMTLKPVVGGVAMTPEKALAFIQNNPQHPAVVAYIASLKAAAVQPQA